MTICCFSSSTLSSLLLLNVLIFTAAAQEPLSNDDCINALPLTEEEPVSSTTTGGTMADPLEISFRQCGGQTFDAGTPGVWFTIDGTGAMLKATTCQSETNNDNGGAESTESSSSHRISVHNGEDCDSLICLDSGLEQDSDCTIAGSSFVEWQSVVGQQYYILVHDPSVSQSGGDFVLTVKDITAPPVNDLCENAAALVESVTMGGTTLGATETSLLLECTSNMEEAPTSRVDPSVGVWYTIPASENEEMNKTSIFLCSESAGLSLAVFSGNSCGETTSGISCVESTATDNFEFQCGSETEIASSVSFNVTAGEEYLVLVYGARNAAFGVSFVRATVGEDTNQKDTNDSPSSAYNTFAPSLLWHLSGLCLFSYLYRINNIL
ncbi:hypothetical protein IV203_005795 [Nitzschia inconspicua]|uniref:Uncharacterized protein n=1 Tax=Nitzschia inconspicua TaxID=303405 RepID=A0A9K3KNQ3_9STRA|nr:hypothetical protein IV203_005795 [Nitzschia inconspicua]